MSVRFEMRVDDTLMARIDSARGSESRAAWIKRALAVALSGGTQEAPASVAATSRVEAAPRRAPEAIPVRDFTAERLERERMTRR